MLQVEVIVRFCAGIVEGIPVSQPVKVYPGLAGSAGAVTGAQRQHAEEHQQRQKEGRESVSPDHPLVPPLETPAMTFLRKIRNSTISGTEMTTTAAIMAGMFSRPKPFSRISWMPLETRK